MARRLRYAPFALVLVCLSSVTFTASASAAPSNDNFGNAARLKIGQPVDGTINAATKQRGEPRHARSLAKHSVWYRLGTSRKVAIGLSTCRSNFDSVVAVYSGRRLGSLREVDFNNDGGCGNGGSRVTFTARPGRVYRIAVAGFTPRGRFRMTVRSINGIRANVQPRALRAIAASSSSRWSWTPSTRTLVSSSGTTTCAAAASRGETPFVSAS